MAQKRDNQGVEAVLDLHGMTAEDARRALQKQWAAWRGMSAVRLIHGQGVVLKPAVERWCEEMGIPYSQDPRNAGAMRIFPRDRTVPNVSLSTTLREKGLQLTPEEEAYLRDPEAIKRARLEEFKRRQEEEQRRRQEAAQRAAQQKRDESLWEAEIARLNAQDRNRSKDNRTDEKPGAPRILPPLQIKHQEGYWKAEIVRVAGTDEQTLTRQKRTGLDKLAPPIEPKKEASPPSRKSSVPQRDVQADQALFEAELNRLDEQAFGNGRRAKRD